MFYRFLSKLATQERLRAFPVSLSCDTQFSNGPRTDYYNHRFERVATADPLPGLTVWHAPHINWKPDLALRFDPGRETTDLPDLWGVEHRLLVSDKAAAIIAASDQLAHDFTPIQWLDADNRPLTTDQTWYWLNVRRFIEIRPGDRIATPDELGFFPLHGDEDFLARVIDQAELRAQLERYPLWSLYDLAYPWLNHIRKLAYLNQTLVDALRAEGVTGIDAYTEAFGIGEQSLAPV